MQARSLCDPERIPTVADPRRTVKDGWPAESPKTPPISALLATARSRTHNVDAGVPTVEKFNAVDGYVHERLAISAGRKHGRAGRDWTTRYTHGWITRLGVYRLTGNVRGATAHARR